MNAGKRRRRSSTPWTQIRSWRCGRISALDDHPKFIVRNLLRQWDGWWNGNPTDLLPATWGAQARDEIASLAGGLAAVVSRGRMLLEQGDLVVASHLAEWATRAEPTDCLAQAVKRAVYTKRMEQAESFMAQNIFRATMNEVERRSGRTRSTRDRLSRYERTGLGTLLIKSLMSDDPTGPRNFCALFTGAAQARGHGARPRSEGVQGRPGIFRAGA